MMVRLLIWILMFYLLWTLLKRGLKFWLLSKRPSETDRMDDLMVKDPFCEVYFPRKDAHLLRIQGKELYFCSPECRENYRRKQAGENL